MCAIACHRVWQHVSSRVVFSPLTSYLGSGLEVLSHPVHPLPADSCTSRLKSDLVLPTTPVTPALAWPPKLSL